MGVIVMGLRIAVIRRQDDVASGRNALDLMQALTGSLPYFLPVLGVSFLVGFYIMLGFLLLIVPGVIFSVSLAFAFFAVVLDGASVGDSLQISRDLVRGHWWRTATIMTIALMIYMAVYLGVTALAALALPFGKVLSVVSANPGPNTLGALLGGIVISLCNAALYPLIYAIALVTYRDLQLRKSGGDLAARIAAVA